MMLSYTRYFLNFIIFRQPVFIDQGHPAETKRLILESSQKKRRGTNPAFYPWHL